MLIQCKRELVSADCIPAIRPIKLTTTIESSQFREVSLHCYCYNPFHFKILFPYLFDKCTNPKSLAFWLKCFLLLVSFLFFINDLVGTYANTV